jgi:hypothetical protein
MPPTLRRASRPWILLVGTLLGSESGSAAPVDIIFDTDMGGDCDDVGALFILHGAVERGEARLLATMGCVSSDAIAPCLDAINAWFGRPDIPVGTLKDPGFLAGPHYTAEVARRFPHKHPAGKDYPDAVALYRRILAKQPDASVVVVAVGPLRNLANLLKSGPDAASPLDGRALAEKKVKRLDVMGGNYPPSGNRKDAEWNFKQDPASAALVASTWPTPILFNGEGGSTCSGRRVTFEMPEHNPLTLAYALYPGVGFAGDRLSWDPVSCLVSVRGAAPWYKVVSGGVNAVDAASGVNTWHAGEDRGHSYLVLQSPKAVIEKALEDLMVAGRGRPKDMTFNTACYARWGSCRISARGAADAQSGAEKAFDNDDRTLWRDKAPSSWIQCQYADGRKYRATSYALVCPEKQRLPRALELSGSNDDGATWTRLDLQENPAFAEPAPRREFALAKPARWGLYRLAVTAADGNEGVSIAAFELNEAIRCRPGAEAAAINLDAKTLSIAVHGRATMNATLLPLDSCEREVVWTSSDPAVAAVRRIGEQTAVVAGRKPGTCTITAAIDKMKQSCAVTVTPSTLPAGWNHDDLNAPAIPGSARADDGRFTLTGCGHAMTSWWERVRDQGVFVSRAAAGDTELSARLTALAPNVGGPAFPGDHRPPTAAGLMIRESLDHSCGRYLLVQAEAPGNLVARWRNRTGDQDDNQAKKLGPVTLPVHLRIVRAGNDLQVYASADGQDWGAPRMSHSAAFDDRSRIGLFVCSGNAFASTTAVFDGVRTGR